MQSSVRARAGDVKRSGTADTAAPRLARGVARLGTDSYANTHAQLGLALDRIGAFISEEILERREGRH
jgi:hypothetical protein